MIFMMTDDGMDDCMMDNQMLNRCTTMGGWDGMGWDEMRRAGWDSEIVNVIVCVLYLDVDI